MAGSLFDYSELKLLDHVQGKASYTMPTTVAAALCTVTITDAMTGATITEANYTGYARKVIAASDLNSASSGSSTNANAIIWNDCTAGSSTILGVAIVDSSTIGAGNGLWYSDVTSKTVDVNNTPPKVAAGSLTLTLS